MEDPDLDTLLAKLAASPQRRTPVQFVGTKRFELRRKIGSGAFGDVWEARDRQHGSIVALKALRSSHPDWIYRFKREFRVVCDLAHPNLVRLYELFVEDDRWYLTMELVDGLPFGEYVRRAPDRMRSCFAQLAVGIAELHRARCIHRDLKPSNVLVEPTGRVVLLDFGLAVQQRAGKTSAIAGTPPYMAPELGLGHPPTESSDWYAFGVMLYEALAGQLPFVGNDVEILQRKLNETPRPPSTVRAGVDEQLEALSLLLLARSPADRPAAAGVLAPLLGHDRASEVIAVRQRARTPIVGRQVQLAALEAALVAAERGPVAVTLRGAPGMGKTVLLDAFVDVARTRTAVYQGRCLELESVPFKGLDGAIDVLCNDLARRRQDDVAALRPHDVAALAQMFPMFKRVEAFARTRTADPVTRTPQEARRAASRALRELFAKLTTAGPIVLAIDDLQWSSVDTIRLLAELFEPPAPRLLLVVAFRDEAAGPHDVVSSLLQTIAAIGIRHVEVSVAPLDREGVEQWLAQESGKAGPITADDALHETHGHPYLLARWLAHGARIRERPPDLDDLLAEELGELDTNARHLLELVAIAATPVPAQAVLRAAGLVHDPSLIDHLRRRKLVLGASTERLLEPYHARVCTAALVGMSDDRRRGLHLTLAAALEAGELSEPDVLARHYREGGALEWALDWTLRAAERATSTLAFARAVELHSQALDLAGTQEARLDLLQRLAEAQIQHGRPAEAAASFETAATLAFELGLARDHARLRSRAGEHYLLAGHFARGFQLMRDALASMGVTLPDSEAVAIAESFNWGGALATRGLRPRPTRVPEDSRLRERVDLVLAVARPLTQTDLRGPMMAARALLDALELGEPHRVQRALSYFVINHASRMPGDPLMEEAEALARSLAMTLGDERAAAWADMATGLHAMYRHEFGTALASLAAAEHRFSTIPDHAREAGISRLATVIVCGNFCVDLKYAGRRHGGFTEEALARGDVFSATWSHLVQIHLELANDAPAEARRLLAETTRMWPDVRDSLLAATMLLHGVAIELYDEPARAWDQLCAIRVRYRQLYTSMIPLTTYLYSRLTANSAIAAVVAGRLRPGEAAAELEALLEPMESSTMTAPRDLVRGHLFALRGDRSSSLAARADAARRWGSYKQAAIEHAVLLRHHELARDGSAATGAREMLGRLGVRDPDRFADLFAGPLLA